ncbi:UNVERIFIED_CONTAM: hypothetical protein FKN15_070975 [Acipenser sinensis]
MAVQGPPDDIFPLVLTSKTQELFQCRADEDLTQDNLHKIIKKEEILNDMKMRAAVSDFYPVKQMVMNYPGEELLLVFDRDFKYGQSFYLVGTEDTKERILHNYPGEELLLVFDRDFKYGQSFYLVGTEDTKERILHPPEPSEEEGVEEEDLMETFVYKTPEPKPWESLGSDLDIEEESVKDSRCKHRYKISRKRREFGAPVMFTDRNASVARDGYIECTSYPDKSFCVKKMEMDTGIQAVPQLQETSTQTKWKYPRNACTQYVPREFTDEEKENFMNSQSLKDFINSVALRINLSAKLVMTPSLILIWSFSDPIHPQLLMECPDDICCFEFCPSDPNIIVGGCINGQPGFEDKNVKKTPIVRYCAVSSIEHGHKAPISDVQWLPDYYEVGLPRIETSGEYSALKVSLKDILQEGRLHGITGSKPSHCFVIHDGLVTTVKRSPFFKDIVLTVGGWTFAIWKEGVMNGPILQSSASQKKCTVGHWSLSRPGVFFIGKEDGNIDIWDLLEKTHEPSQTQNISTGQITCIKPWIVSSKQHLLAVSDEFGTLHILEIPWTLRHPSSNEKLSVTNYFEREVKHLNYSEKRREFREQEKRDMDAEELRRLSGIVHEKTAEQLEEEVQQEFREYLKLEKHILSDMGLIKPAEDTPLPGV